MWAYKGIIKIHLIGFDFYSFIYRVASLLRIGVASWVTQKKKGELAVWGKRKKILEMMEGGGGSHCADRGFDGLDSSVSSNQICILHLNIYSLFPPHSSNHI